MPLQPQVRDVNGRDRDETEMSAFRDVDIDNFRQDETETRHLLRFIELAN